MNQKMVNALDPQNLNNFSEASVSVEIETEDMTLNIGPQHPSTHGVLRLVAKVDGEKVHDVKPVLGYMHRGYEKLAEVRTMYTIQLGQDPNKKDKYGKELINISFVK